MTMGAPTRLGAAATFFAPRSSMGDPEDVVKRAAMEKILIKANDGKYMLVILEVS